MGPCRIVEYLSRGGMGHVYRAKHLALDRDVALKIFEPPMVNGDAIIRSVTQEARAAARLEDARIVQVYEVGQSGPFCYIVMQLVKGETLERRVKRAGPLIPLEAVQTMREVLLGLSVAHRMGIVHRDMKPGNIMIDESGQPRIMDFGIAARVGAEEMEAAGSVDFMAPEQAYGAKPDPRADLYAFGAVFYFTLTGKVPFPSASAADTILQHRDAPVPDVRDRNPDVTPFASRLIARLMEKFPDARPRDTDEVLRALDDPEMLGSAGVMGAAGFTRGLPLGMPAFGSPRHDAGKPGAAPPREILLSTLGDAGRADPPSPPGLVLRESILSPLDASSAASPAAAPRPADAIPESGRDARPPGLPAQAGPAAARPEAARPPDPPPAARQPSAPPPAASTASRPPGAALPPLPSIGPVDLMPPVLSKVIFVALVIAGFGQHWVKAVHADWLAAALFCAGCLAFLSLGARKKTWVGKSVGLALFALMAFSFYSYALPGSGVRAPRAWPSLELLILLGLSAGAGVGAVWEGIFDEHSPSQDLALWLLAGSVAGLGLGIVSMRVAGQGAWLAGAKGLLAGEARAFFSSSGPLRWMGFVVLYLGSWVFFPKRKAPPKRFEGRVIGYV